MRFFMLEEFECKCKNKHCSGKIPQLQMKPQLIQALNRIRAEFKEPITVTSGFRCQDHNEAIGGAKASQHLLGAAADIKPTKNDPGDLDRLYKLCEAEPEITGLARASSFIHVDVRPLRPDQKRKMWKY